MTQPNYPLIIIYNNEVLTVIPTEAHLCKPTAFGTIKPTDREIVFDGNGNKWTYRLTNNQSNQAEISFEKRLLFYTFPSPVIIVKPEWTKQGIYQLQELKEIISRCIDKDGVITKFADAAIIKTAIDKAKSFDEVYKTLNNYIFKVNKYKLWKEQAL